MRLNVGGFAKCSEFVMILFRSDWTPAASGAAFMVPSIVAAFYLPKYAIGIVDKGYIRKTMLRVSFLAAIVAIVKALRLLNS